MEAAAGAEKGFLLVQPNPSIGWIGSFAELETIEMTGIGLAVGWVVARLRDNVHAC